MSKVDKQSAIAALQKLAKGAVEDSEEEEKHESGVTSNTEFSFEEDPAEQSESSKTRPKGKLRPDDSFHSEVRQYKSSKRSKKNFD